jgi:hypothetical protein
LEELTKWADEQIWILRPLVSDAAAEKLESPEAVPSQTVLEHVAVPDLYQSWELVRQVREMWDSALREFEDAWDSRAAVRHRYYIVRWALLTLQESFIDPETREAQDEKTRKELRRAQKKIRQQFMPGLGSGLGDPFEDDEDEEEDEGDDEYDIFPDDWTPQ